MRSEGIPKARVLRYRRQARSVQVAEQEAPPGAPEHLHGDHGRARVGRWDSAALAEVEQPAVGRALQGLRAVRALQEEEHPVVALWGAGQRVARRTRMRLPVAPWTLYSEDLRQGQVLPDVTYPGVVYVGHRQQPYVIVLAQRNFRELRQREVCRKPPLRGWVDRDKKKGRRRDEAAPRPDPRVAAPTGPAHLATEPGAKRLRG
jgi:hypothetical protein